MGISRQFSVLVTVLGCLSALADGGSQLEIKRYRFNKHETLHFDRLVFEFGAKGLHGAPALRVLPKGKETLVSVDKVSLVGGIPEANVNESYSKKAEYLGPVSFNTDSHDGFSIRVFTKQENTKVEAFWLESSNRLVIDAFPPTSERAQGPHVLQAERHVASQGHGRKAAAHGAKTEGVYCFNSASQVKASLSYENGDKFKGIPMTVEAPAQGAPVSDNIVCYPKSAQVVPKVFFSNGEAPARVEASVLVPEDAPRADVKPIVFPTQEKKSLLPPSSGWVPPTSPKLPPSSGWVPPTAPAKADREASNEDSDEGARKTASQDNSWEDNFNKNNPPPTLGKSLLPPGGGGAGARVKPQLATPGSLLPPLK